MTDFDKWCRDCAGSGRPAFSPHPWQQQLAADGECRNRLIRIPTGMGKTFGVLLAWAWHRFEKNNHDWPRRLVWCLPMRALVDQTANEAASVLANAGLSDQVAIHRLLGGVGESDWYLRPEQPAILIGTQDMLLSRALNRGYAMGRAAWPRAFGLINTDTLWVMDEVQLMGVGLTTSAQIQSFWQSQTTDNGLPTPPRATWWMSATLQPQWLRSPETESLVNQLTSDLLQVRPADRSGVIWEANKALQVLEAQSDDWAKIVSDNHLSHSADPATGRQTLVVVNRVKHAKELFQSLQKQLKSLAPHSADGQPPELRLVHSRFRLHERAQWSSEFLSRGTLHPGVNRIIIATQVVEAGVDISASCLISEIAPWPSLVQRFGRAARYGGDAQIIVLDSRPDEKSVAPYELDQIDGAREALQRIADATADVSIRSLEDFEQQLAVSEPEMLQRLYPFRPLHVLLPHEFDELFDTSTDLSGGDMDVSRFIREGDERDIKLFWRKLDISRVNDRPAADVQPRSEEICSVAITEAKGWVKKLATDAGKAWQWSYQDGQWERVQAERLRPGMLLLLAADVGGYDSESGFMGEKAKKGAPSLDLSLGNSSMATSVTADELADRVDAADSLSEALGWKTIFTHGREAGDLAAQLAEECHVGDRLATLFSLVLRLHDWGKAHPAFAQGTYRVTPPRTDLAKAPANAWPAFHQFYRTDSHGPRRGFRHELASCLATLELLRQANPQHPAILGELGDWFADTSAEQSTAQAVANNPISVELSELSKAEFNLVLYLILSHHGKVRVSLQATAKDQDFPYDWEQYVGTGMPIRGVRDGDTVPAIGLPDAAGNLVEMPAIELSLAAAAIGLSKRYGASWTERVLDLLTLYGPFRLGYWEALVRAIDTEASMLPDADATLQGQTLSVPDIVPQSQAADASSTDDFAGDWDSQNQLDNDLEESDV